MISHSCPGRVPNCGGKLFNAIDANEVEQHSVMGTAALLSPHGQWPCREDLFSAKADQNGDILHMSWDRQARLFVMDCYRCTSLSKWDASGAVQCWWGDKKL